MSMYTQLVQDLKSVLATDSILKELKKVKELSNTYQELKNKDNTEDDVNKLLAQDLLDEIQRKIELEKEKRKAQEDALRNEKQKLIDELDELIQNEQNIGKAYSTLKSIRESWTKASEEGAFKLKDLDQRFTKLIEDFYYNINIYKAIQDHDLKRNQQLKDQLLIEIEKLSKTEASRQLMVEVKSTRSKWEAIGPVKRELQDEYWNKYRGFLDLIYTSFDQYKESEKEQHVENLQKKKDIITLIQNIDIDSIKSGKEWKNLTQKVLDQQKAWKEIGHVPKNEKDTIWVEYRAICDVFFNAKKEYLDAQKEKFKANKKTKISLCKEAEDWVNHEDLKEATDKFVSLQKKWKNVGPVHQRDEQFLWHKFQKACNAFFNKKKEASKQLDLEKDAVNVEKENILNELNNLEIKDENNLKSIYVSWLNSNRSHTKKSNALQKAFNKAFEAALASININDEEFYHQNFEEKINVYKSFNDNGNMLDRERAAINELANQLKKEIIQYENNLGFFGNSKGAESLLKEVQDKISNSKLKLENLQEKIKQIRLA